MERKWVHVLFALFGIGTMFVLVKGLLYVQHVAHIRWANELVIYGISAVVAFVIALLLWRANAVFGFVAECVQELEKVSWSNRKEVTTATLVVVVTVSIVSICMWLFDYLWNLLFSRLYAS